MKRNRTILKNASVALLAAVIPGVAGADDSADALLKMLQRKGLLSEAEVVAIRKEQKQNAAAIKPAATNWAANTKVSGDFRGRFEGLYGGDPAFQDRSRFRYRARAGLVSSLGEQFELGVRLTSGEGAAGVPGGDPIGGNTTLQDNASKKLIFVDLAYAKWREFQNDQWTAKLTLGKMENPFVFSDLVFDHDYTPEGLAQQLTWKIDERHTGAVNLAGFVLDGIGAFEVDAFLAGTQFRLDSKWNENWTTSAGAALLAIVGEDQLVNGAVPNQNRGNSRPGVNAYGPGALSEEYTPIAADVSVTYSIESVPMYPGRFPIKIGGDYLYNFGANSRNQAASIGTTFGKSGKKGQWELSYRYKYLEGDAWYEELVDSDFGALYAAPVDAGGAAGCSAGTNVRGHVLKTAYSLTDSFSIGASAAFTELIQPSPANLNSGFTRVQFDTCWKF